MEAVQEHSNAIRVIWFSRERVRPKIAKDFLVDFFTETDLLADALASDYYSAIVVQFEKKNKDWLTTLELARKVAPQTTRILIGDQIDPVNLIEALNRGGIYSCISGKSDHIAEVLFKASGQHQGAIQRKKLLEGVRSQNRQLENLNINLENLVHERTIHLEEANQEAEANLLKMRDLTHFVQELALLRSIDELLLLIQKELRHFHELRPPILSYVSLDGKAQIISIQGKQIFERSVRSPWPNQKEVRVGNRLDQTYLANEFGRPLGKILAIPLSQKLSRTQNEERLVPQLYFEHNFHESEISTFLRFLADRVQSISIALDRILLESHLKFTSQQWEGTFDGIKDPIAIMNSSFDIVRANRHFVGGSFAPKCYQSFQASDIKCAGCPVTEALEAGQPRKGIIKKAGKFYEVYSYPIRMEGELQSAAVINHYVDVTETRELHGRVVQTEKMAAIGFLAGNIAHELNNPLTGIRSLSQIFISEIKDQPQLKEDLTEVEKAAERSQKIIENLLQFAKGATQSSEVPIALNEIVRKTLPMLKTSFREHRTHIELESTEAKVLVEPQLMQQVVFNLVNNACQAMKEQGSLSITTSLDEKGICFAVEDTGEGIPEALLESIFEPFFTTKKEGQGTGLGLSMSRNIVRKFQGDISVSSKVGTGSKFSVHLPLGSVKK